MLFITITIFSVTGSLVALAIAKPVPNWKASGGIAIPLTRHSPSLNSNTTIDLDTVTSHAISVREKILDGLDNYEMNMGTMHPFAVKRSESGLERRGAIVPLTPTSRGKGWMAEISIGTPPKTLTVHIDTGAADMWVLQAGCDGIPEDPSRNLWDPHLSDTSAYEAEPPFRLKYSDGTIVEGDLYSDNITIGGFTADPHTFGSASSYAGPFQNNVNSDGLLGLAFPSISKFGVDPLFESLLSQRSLINPTFSLKLASSGAEMYLGGANSMLYNGNIAYTRVTNPGFWEVSIDDIRVNGDTILENVPAIFDTGASYIFGDWERVSELYKSVGGTLLQHNDFGYYSLPCDSFPTVTFTFNSAPFEIPPEVLTLAPIGNGSPDCLGSIVAHRTSSTEHWIIGMTFLENVYTVFDYGTLQVGFAKLA